MPEPAVVVIDADDSELKTNGQDQPKKTLKRKRASLSANLTDDQKAAQIESLKKELEGLFGYYGEVMSKKDGFGLDYELDGNVSTLNGMVGFLIEESELALSKLVEEIYGKLCKQNNVSVTMAMVKNAVLSVGRRVMYGVPNLDADVLEDETPACRWCWETRDLKMMPTSVCGELKIRRTCRKKIHERISAVSAMVAALQKAETDQNYKTDLVKASDKLSKVLEEADIRLFVNSMQQTDGVEMGDKKAKQEQKLLIKQLEKNKRELEKEKRRLDLKLQKEKRQIEKENKRSLEDAAKDEKRREKEESEMRRQLRKQQAEAEKEQQRKEREESELKRQIAIKKQASMMEQFLKRSKEKLSSTNDETSTKATTSDMSIKQRAMIPEPVTVAMDCILASIDDIGINDIRKFHLSSWHHLGQTMRSSRKQHWSIRQKPKIELVKKLRLTGNREMPHYAEITVESGWEEQSSNDRSCMENLESNEARKCLRRKQLLQFDKSHRPAFYGIWSKKSFVVGPRQPFRKEPDLDYDVDSDEEWEEEDPGESLSDCDKDDEQSLEEGCSKDDEEEESEDGFFVPDGYLSENEGVQVDRMETDNSTEDTRVTLSCKQDLESEEFRTLLQQQKHLKALTDHALRKNQPSIILNLMHEKDLLLVSENLTGTSKLEKECLEALRMRNFPGGPPIEICAVNMQTDDQDDCLSSCKTLASTTTIQDLDTSIVVSAIQSCSQSINKVVESLQQKFPTVSKSQLRNKVREISDFVDNRWQVKKEIMDKVGLSISPEKVEKGRGRTQNIWALFSKRCLPPAAGKTGSPDGSSR